MEDNLKTIAISLEMDPHDKEAIVAEALRIAAGNAVASAFALVASRNTDEDDDEDIMLLQFDEDEEESYEELVSWPSLDSEDEMCSD